MTAEDSRAYPPGIPPVMVDHSQCDRNGRAKSSIPEAHYREQLFRWWYVGGPRSKLSLLTNSTAAVDPSDSDLKIASDISRFKDFSTGGVVLDLTVLEGVYDGAESHIFTIVPTNQPGIQFKVSSNFLAAVSCTLNTNGGL